LFFSHFDISPEDAGVSFDWLAVRAFLIAVVVLAVVLIARFLSRNAERYGPAVRIVESRAVVIAAKLLLALSVGTAIGALIRRSFGYSLVMVLIPALLVLGTGIWIWLNPSSEPLQIAWNARILLKGVAGALAGFVVAALVCFPYRMTAQLAGEVKAGRPVQVSILPGLIAFEVVRMRVVFIPNSDSTSSVIRGKRLDICLMHLGGSDGNSYFYDFQSGHVLVLNDQDIVARQPC
jgi:hypothetical protein